MNHLIVRALHGALGYLGDDVARDARRYRVALQQSKSPVRIVSEETLYDLQNNPFFMDIGTMYRPIPYPGEVGRFGFTRILVHGPGMVIDP